MRRYLLGSAGSGKTTQLAQQLVALVNAGTRPDRILVLVPQMAQAERFRTALAQAKGNTRGEPQMGTIYSLAQQHVGLFFPLIADLAGFAKHGQEPTFINIEAAQFFLNQIVQPRSTEFDDLKLYRPRLLSQILDSMTKAATSGFELTELAQRLASAWTGEPSRIESYKRMQAVAIAFRAFCLQHNLLDFSLTMHCFTRHLLQAKSYQDYVAAKYRHLIADNVEEGTPALHDFIKLTLQSADSAMLAEDTAGGYRLFLGADPKSAAALRSEVHHFGLTIDDLRPAQTHADIASFGQAIADQLAGKKSSIVNRQSSIQVGSTKYWVQQVDWVAARIGELVEAGVAPSEIAVLAPYVEDVLRFELNERLRSRNIGIRSLRPSRPLYDHPVTRALATLARLAHRHWEQAVSPAELARALSIAIDELDIIRAQLIADAALKISPNTLAVVADQALWNRVGMRFRERYVRLANWLTPAALESEGAGGRGRPLDLFWQQLFTDVLSQAGFGFSQNREGAQVCDKLIRNARTFREVFEQAGIAETEVQYYTAMPVLALSPKPAEPPRSDIGLAYVNLLGEGIMAAQYAPDYTHAREMEREAGGGEVLLATVYAYLTGDFRSRVQFWLDLNSPGWHERIYQPLTHPYVLSRSWNAGVGERGLGSEGVWTEQHEHAANLDMLRRVIGGLTARCSERLYLSSSQLGINGQEEPGLLARTVQRVLAAIGD